jgi:hypothetical protein
MLNVRSQHGYPHFLPSADVFIAFAIIASPMGVSSPNKKAAKVSCLRFAA